MSDTTDADETMVDYDSDIMSDDLSKPDRESLLRSLRDAEERNKSLLAQALALKELNENLEKEVNRLKVNYNKLDDECADLWWEQLSEKREPLVHHRKPSPTSVPVNFGFNMQAYLDSIEPLKEKILSEEEKLELRVKRVLLAKDVVDGKGCGQRDRELFDWASQQGGLCSWLSSSKKYHIRETAMALGAYLSIRWALQHWLPSPPFPTVASPVKRRQGDEIVAELWRVLHVLESDQSLLSVDLGGKLYRPNPLDTELAFSTCYSAVAPLVDFTILSKLRSMDPAMGPGSGIYERLDWVVRHFGVKWYISCFTSRTLIIGY
ncbi:hypothetical protein BT96DRAFT_994869 [Gymnopus androsaceus JB14]|uniref:Uncharacterized protein n=1 Tax=Gymnopus androsaceus JB14 TaxID=1447944 RepID=A0A6A4HK59_9AGAR|nr:hypothetical protein BT96DRAFT_994869 [Gymnopus androsaceus JB14]